MMIISDLQMKSLNTGYDRTYIKETLDPEGLALAKRLTALDEHIRLRSGTPETEED